MELILANSTTAIPSHVSVPSVLLQIFAGLQTLQVNTSQPQVLVQILPQPHSHFMQQTDRGKQLVEENRLLRLRAHELLDSVVHIQNVVQEFEEQTQAAAKQTASIIDRLRRNQELMNAILEQHGDPSGTNSNSSSHMSPFPGISPQDVDASIFDSEELEKDSINAYSTTREGNNNLENLDEGECFPIGTKDKLYGFIKELRDLQAQVDGATVQILKSDIFANSSWLHKGLENCLYFQEATEQKDLIIKELRKKLNDKQHIEGGTEIALPNDNDQNIEDEELKERLKHLKQVSDKREEVFIEMTNQLSSTIDELKVTKDQLRQYQDLVEEKSAQWSETRDQLEHFQQLAEVRQMMLLEAQQKLTALEMEVKGNHSDGTVPQVPEVQKLIDGRHHISREDSSEEVVTIANNNQTIMDNNNRQIDEDTKHKARTHEILAGRSKEAALMDAAERGDVEQLEFLLDLGAHVDARDTTKKQTSLMRAAESGHVEAVRFLIQKGANMEARATGWYNLTPLLYAAANKHLDVVKLLVGAGADVTAVDSLGKSASVLGGQEVEDWLEGRTP